MDIEGFVDAPGRAEQVAQVREQIDRLGVQYLYLQFVSVTGRICGKGIPADHWESIAERGFQLVYGATVNLFLNRHGDYLGYGPHDKELVGIPEPDTFCQLPWDKRVARLWCTLFRNREERDQPGAFLTADCRGNLRRIHEQFQAEHGGLHLRHGTEPEMMWLKRGEDGKPDGGFSNPYCYHIDQFESLRPVYHESHRVFASAMGLDMIQGDHEDAPGQLELNFTFDDAVAHGGPAHHLSTGVCAGSAGVQPHRVLHVQAFHGRLGFRLPSQHQRSGRGGEDSGQVDLGARVGRAARHDEECSLTCRAAEKTCSCPMGTTRRCRAPVGQQVIGGIVEHLSRGADGHRLLHGQFIPETLGHRFLGACIRGLGVPESHNRSPHIGSRPIRVSIRGLDGEPAT